MVGYQFLLKIVVDAGYLLGNLGDICSHNSPVEEKSLLVLAAWISNESSGSAEEEDRFEAEHRQSCHHHDRR